MQALRGPGVHGIHGRAVYGRAVSAQHLGLGALELGVVGLLGNAGATGAATLVNATLQPQTEHHDQSKTLNQHQCHA